MFASFWMKTSFLLVDNNITGIGLHVSTPLFSNKLSSSRAWPVFSCVLPSPASR